MASIMYPLGAQVKGDDFGYFMVYAIPLHFFPVLVWFAFKPLFFRRIQVIALTNDETVDSPIG